MPSSVLSHLLPHSAGGLLLLSVALLAVYQISIYIYNLFFHPLRRFPGPKLAAASCFPRVRHALNGELIQWVVQLHLQYGEVVRVTPNELSFSGAEAWKDIYGHKRAGQPTLTKDPKFYGPPMDGDRVTDIINADDEGHARQRKIFANAFSDRALKMQEPLFLTYVNKLVEKLRGKITQNAEEKFNMVNMYNFTTFGNTYHYARPDIMGDLTFGEPLDMLDDTGYHPWVASIFAGFRFGTYLHCIRCYPALETALLKLVPQSIRDKQKMHNEFSHARVDRRLEKQDARPDIWGLVLEKEGNGGLSKREMYANSNIFMLAGTETTATLLSGMTYYLLSNPEKLAKLTAEIRSIETEEEITIERLQSLKYLHACIEEGLRMYPPVSNGLPRVVPLGGAVVDGQQVPAGAQIYVTNLAANRNPNNFREPSSFIPERWLPESTDFASDKKHALQPFSTGPRVCLGRNMAYHEIRIILAKVLWNFDLQLCSESDDWIDQKIYIFWDKGPLYCQLRPVKREA
ncbi:hypothetical protein LTR85_007700 [Meristemomyces frigidus]|nr:hypothetical protein LTR85_007700 [Meristemomyces frigidus]